MIKLGRGHVMEMRQNWRRVREAVHPAALAFRAADNKEESLSQT